MKIVSGIISKFLILLIKGYQVAFSPFFPHTCRHIPSCSKYALAAIEMHGPGRGAVLAVRRLLSCHPWGSHGYDPVPLKSHTHAD